MIFRRYGSWYHSVRMNFNPNALNEVGLQRDMVARLSPNQLEEAYALEREVDLDSKAEGDVQKRVEAELLAKLESKVRDLAAELPEGSVLVVRSDSRSWPKSRERRETLAKGGEGRLRFHRWIEPPLRLAVYRRR